MLTSHRQHTIYEAGKATVQIDYTDIHEAAHGDVKTSLALAIYHRSGTEEKDALAFLKRVRWAFSPDPAHMVDTSARAILDYRMMDQEPDAFVMDGERCQGQYLSEISSPLAREVATHTYFHVKQTAQPALFTVTMPERVYRRLMFPFHNGGQVTRIVTLVHPLLNRMKLRDILN